MWFEAFMDTCKSSYLTALKHKGIFVPIFIKLAMHIVLGVLGIIAAVIIITSGAITASSRAEPVEVVIGFLVPFSILAVLGYILYTLLWGMIEIGTINLFKAASQDENLTKSHFFNGIKMYIDKVFRGRLLIHFLTLILSPLLVVLFIIYAILLGIPTGGWALVFLGTSVSVFFATWTMAIVVKEMNATKGIAESFRFGRKHFKTMFILILSLTMISQYSIMLFGPLGFILTGWFIGGVIDTYFKFVIYGLYTKQLND